MTPKKELIKVELIDGSINATNNIKIEGPIVECSPHFTVKSNCTVMISEDLDKIVKHEKDLLDDCMWESTMEIQKTTNQNGLLGPFNQNVSNCKSDENTTYRNAFPCKICKESFPLHFQLKIHMMNHKKQTQAHKDLNKCKLCGKQFKLNFTYNRHAEKCHLFECEICGEFVNKTQYTEHITNHESGSSGNKTDFIPNLKLCKLNGVWKSKRNYKCNSCFEKFYTKNNLIEHMKRHEDNDFDTMNEDSLKYTSFPELKTARHLFKCQKCNLNFDQKCIFDHHISWCSANSGNTWNKFRGNFKTNKNLFFCKGCGIGFHNRLLLKNHMILDCKMFICKYCGRKFNKRNSWLKHKLQNQNHIQCIKSNINSSTTYNRNLINSDSHSMKINLNPDERSDQIDAVYKNASTIRTMPYHVEMNNCNLNLQKKNIVSSKIVEKYCIDQTNSANSNESTLYTVPHNLMMNGCSLSKEKYLCSNTTERNYSDQINVTNYYESTSQIELHNVKINYCSASIKKEKTDDRISAQQINAANSYESTLPPVPSNSIVNGFSPSLNNIETISKLTTIRNNSDLTSEGNNSNITEINNSDQINSVKKCETIVRPTSLAFTLYNHSLNLKKEKIESFCSRNVSKIKSFNHIVNSNVSTEQISKCNLAVKQEHALLNNDNNYPFIVRETVYLSIRKSSSIEKIPDINTDCNLKSTYQRNFKFICKICHESSFLDIHTFALHMSDHSECSMHECIVCDKTFTTVLHWKNHMTSHQQEVDLNLLNHIEIESNNRIGTSNSESMIPQVSSTPFRNKQNTISKLISEFKNSRRTNLENSAKKSKREYHCNICSKIFYSHLTLTVHQTVHNISRPFSCKYCDKTFSSKGPCTNHEKSHNSDKNNVLNENEEECEPIIETLNYVEIEGNNVSTFSCKYCERTFSSRGPCTNHEKSHVSYVNKLLSYSIEDEEHINSQSIESENNTNIVKNYVEKFPCNYCDKTYLSKGACTKHEKSHNSDEKNIVNTESKEECGNIKNIETPNDIKIVGNSVGTFSCKYCERAFSSRGPCTNHEKSHTTPLNYLNLYSIEDKELISSGSIESQNNTNIEKFPCNYCDKTYLSKAACTKHEKSHNSDKKKMFDNEIEEECENMKNIETLNDVKILGKSVGTFSCKYCERTFSSRGPCTNHEKSHTMPLNYLNLYSIEDKELSKFRPVKTALTIEKKEDGPIYTLNKVQVENGNVDYHENKKKVNKFVCLVCKKIFTKRCYLTNHMTLLHKVDPNSHEQHANLNNKMSSINSKTSYNTGKNKLIKKEKKVIVNSRFKNKSVSCTICKKHFVHNGTLSSHMKSHSNLKPYKCQYCDKKFNMKGPWTLHEKTHKLRKEFLSNKVKIEPNEEQLIENGDNSELVEKICDNSSVNINENAFDVNDNKQNRMWFVCDVCDKKFSTPFKLIIHRKSSCLVEPYVCTICNRSYTVRHRWNRHLKSHYIKNKLVKNSKKNKQTNKIKLDTSKLFIKPMKLKNQYKCNYCKKQYSLISYWKKHLSLSKECRRHCKRGLPEFNSVQAKEKFLNTKSLLFQCHICKKTYSTAYNRKIHLMSIHNISKDCETQCKICGKNYSNKANLNRHYSVIHTKGNKAISCNDCGRTFKHVYSYQEHVRINSLKLQQNDKSICSSNKNLIQHTISINKCNVKYSCKICKMEFADNIMLQRHLKTHMVTMYKCKDCNQLFKSNIILSKHILENHNTKISLNKSKHSKNNAIQNTPPSTNDVSTKCQICLKVLKTPKYLSHHMRLHSGIKPFKCDYCNMAFRFNSNLRIHRTRYHLEETNMS